MSRRWRRSAPSGTVCSHGGIEFTESCVVDDACEAAIKKCFPLGPLHNPANLMGIKACQAAMPGVPQVAVFDTSFGMSMTPGSVHLRHSV